MSWTCDFCGELYSWDCHNGYCYPVTTSRAAQPSGINPSLQSPKPPQSENSLDHTSLTGSPRENQASVGDECEQVENATHGEEVEASEHESIHRCSGYSEDYCRVFCRNDDRNNDDPDDGRDYERKYEWQDDDLSNGKTDCYQRYDEYEEEIYLQGPGPRRQQFTERSRLESSVRRRYASPSNTSRSPLRPFAQRTNDGSFDGLLPTRPLSDFLVVRRQRHAASSLTARETSKPGRQVYSRTSSHQHRAFSSRPTSSLNLPGRHTTGQLQARCISPEQTSLGRSLPEPASNGTTQLLPLQKQCGGSSKLDRLPLPVQPGTIEMVSGPRHESENRKAYQQQSTPVRRVPPNPRHSLDNSQLQHLLSRVSAEAASLKPGPSSSIGGPHPSKSLSEIPQTTRPTSPPWSTATNRPSPFLDSPPPPPTAPERYQSPQAELFDALPPSTITDIYPESHDLRLGLDRSLRPRFFHSNVRRRRGRGGNRR